MVISGKLIGFGDSYFEANSKTTRENLTATL